MSFQRHTQVVFLEKQVNMNHHVHDKPFIASEKHKQSSLGRRAVIDQHMMDKSRERDTSLYRYLLVSWLAVSNTECFIFLM